MRFERTAQGKAAFISSDERQVLALLGRGATLDEAAAQLGLPAAEVERYRVELIRKLQAMAAEDQANAGASGRFARADSMSASENSGSSSVPAR
jgi:FixJ family two-component response regulator